MPKTLYRPEAVLLRQRLRTARESAGITQIALSEALGKSQTFVSDVERGIRRLDLIELWDFCAALDLDLPKFVAAFQKDAASERRKQPKQVKPDGSSKPRKRT